MAKIIPSKKEILESKVKPTSGEFYLLEKLERELDKTYTLFFQSYLNGGNPDIIVFRKGYGVFIIEVKDWNLNCYSYEQDYNKYGQVRVISNGKNYITDNPIRQVQGYKDSLYKIYIYKLAMSKICNSKYYGLIKTGIYFYNANEWEVKSFFKSNNQSCNRINRFGRDSDISKVIRANTRYGNFDLMEIFNDIEVLITPKYHKLLDTSKLNLNKKQRELIVSRDGDVRKVKGESGAGKTTVIAHRAVNILNRKPNGKVLILTFNISLRNYVRDRISNVRGNFNWNRFNIIHFHGFIGQENEKYGFLNNQKEDYKKLNLEVFEHIKVEEKYDGILIDEGQDFEYEWFKWLRDNYLKKDGEFLIFADEKQNIYNRELEKKLVKTNIIGKFKDLGESYRLKGRLLNLAYKFQKEFYKEKYEIVIENPKESQLKWNVLEEEIEYSYLENIELEQIFDEVRETIFKEKIQFNDITILGDQIAELRKTEEYINEKYSIECETIFESEKEYREIKALRDRKVKPLEEEIRFIKAKLAFNLNDEKSLEIIECKKKEIEKIDNNFKRALEELRKIKKFGFNQNSGKLKISTIHSFKGWESEYIVIVLERDHKNVVPELIYAAITRCKRKLIIYNRGNEEYDKFFRENATLLKGNVIQEMPPVIEDGIWWDI